MSNIPRKLNDDEIENIVSDIPSVLISDNDKKEIKLSLQSIKIVPEGIPELTKEVLYRCWKISNQKRDTIGVINAVSLGGPISSVMLDDHHRKSAGLPPNNHALNMLN